MKEKYTYLNNKIDKLFYVTKGRRKCKKFNAYMGESLEDISFNTSTSVQYEIQSIIDENIPKFKGILSEKDYLEQGNNIRSELIKEYKKCYFNRLRLSIINLINEKRYKKENCNDELYGYIEDRLVEIIKPTITKASKPIPQKVLLESFIRDKISIIRWSDYSKNEIREKCFQRFMIEVESSFARRKALQLLINFQITKNEIINSRLYNSFIESENNSFESSKYCTKFKEFAWEYHRKKHNTLDIGFKNGSLLHCNLKIGYWEGWTFKPIEFLDKIDLEDCNFSRIETLDNRFHSLLKRELTHLNKFNNWINLSGHEFEREIMNVLSVLGFKGYVTSGSDDGGIDIVLDGGIGIQCKNHKKPISPNSIRDFLGSCISQNLKKMIFISSNGYSSKAMNLAKSNNILPLDLNDIIKIKNREIDLNLLLNKKITTENNR